jgi:hypothetical protein
MQLKDRFVIDFGAEVEDADPMIANWPAPEAGRRWGSGARTNIKLPRPDADGELALLVTVDPFLFPPILRHQTFRITVNGSALKQVQLRHRTTLVCRIDQSLLISRPEIDIVFDHPDMARPDMISDANDDHAYSVAYLRLALLDAPVTPPAPPLAALPELANTPLPHLNDLTEAALLSHFASLGDNCEFGIVQRRVGIEPMDLLRFAGVAMTGLLRGLEAGFEGIDDYEQSAFHIHDGGGVREYVNHVSLYEFEAHTNVLEGEMKITRLIDREMKRLRMLRRTLLDDLRTGTRIFVYKRNDLRNTADFMPLFQRLRIWGPATLLVVVLADAAHPAGTVELVQDGFLKAYIDKFNPYDDAGHPASPLWLDICRQAYSWWRERRDASQPILSLASA